MLQRDSELLSPLKYPLGVKQMDNATDELFLRTVSAIRQPIESLFAWLLEKTDIQRASRVRSVNISIIQQDRRLIYQKKRVQLLIRINNDFAISNYLYICSDKQNQCCPALGTTLLPRWWNW